MKPSGRRLLFLDIEGTGRVGSGMSTHARSGVGVGLSLIWLRISRGVVELSTFCARTMGVLDHAMPRDPAGLRGK